MNLKVLFLLALTFCVIASVIAPIAMSSSISAPDASRVTEIIGYKIDFKVRPTGDPIDSPIAGR